MERPRPEQLAELAFLLECALRGTVSRRSLDGRPAQLGEREGRRAAAEALRARLVEKDERGELGGSREAALRSAR